MFKSVKSKVALIYIGLVATIILLGVISIWNMVRISGTIDGLIVTNYNSIVRLNSMKETLREQDKAIYAHIYGGATDSREKIAGLNEEFLVDYYNEFQTIVIPAETVFIDNILSEYNAYAELLGEVLDYGLDDPAGLELAKRFYENDVTIRQAGLEAQIRDLYESNETALLGRKAAAAASARNSILLLGIIFPAAALGGYWLATLYTKRFFAPLYAITQSVMLVREGNLDSKTQVSTEDEFGVLASEFNNMTRRLREFEDSAIGSLINERSKTDSLVKSINEPLVVLDKDLAIVEMNEAFMALFGIMGDCKGLPFNETIVHEDLLNIATRAINHYQSEPPSGETIALNSKGEELFYHTTGTRMLGRNDEPIGLIVMLHNITELKLLEKARGDFIATISHEFKTPLTGIMMGADLISDELVGPLNSEQREILDTIREDSERLGVLVGEVLELSKIESFEAIYDFKDCDIGQIVSVSIKQFSVQAERSGISLDVICPVDMPCVKADFSKITWVLNNLLSNALKYTGSGDSVTVEVSCENGEVQVSVMDTGVGVPEDLVDNIFERFIPIKEYDIEVRGSGVGLAVSKEIIDAHGGRIWCESRRAQGSKFSFTVQPVSLGGEARHMEEE